ncbi:hypothetical protein DCAR_0311757 [Daucus carota subsp. sativus]|uniref:Uncharacterized protein n=1 Tax=Daucus carota subsp. sativus TaxID=79200 RepID=A0A162AIX1_DAUCS|nr:hypothetical protein DCAR_0311757 [Daucus carota subsp. sativus]
MVKSGGEVGGSVGMGVTAKVEICAGGGRGGGGGGVGVDVVGSDGGGGLEG